jgi:cytochrome c nitrite reductase small subunit
MKNATKALLAGSIAGAAVGVVAYTFAYAKGWSYLTDDPAACANCHVMGEQLAGWVKSSHRSVAACNDCHTPHTFVGKYATKARNGFWHSFYFTSGSFVEPIQITPASRSIAEQACRDCHGDVVDAMDGPHDRPDRPACTRCHAGVGHAK